MAYLRSHAVDRRAPATGRLLRYRNGAEITYRRYDGLWQRISDILPWVAVQARWLDR